VLKKICKPGEVIFREGDESTEAYWIISGRVEITIRSGNFGLPVARVGGGEIIGEMGLIDNKPRSATATALALTELEVISECDFEKEVLQNTPRMKTYLGTLFERIRGLDTLLEMERARRPISAPPAAAPVAPAQSSAPVAPEPVVTMASQVPNPISKQIIKVDVDRFPFRIGREGGQWSPFFQNELSIPDGNPLQVSRQHASIDTGGGKCFMRDRGSRTGTIVNGVRLHTGEGELVAELKQGENTVVFGNPASQHRYTVTVSAAR
jgi:hypothetical protein